MPKMIRRNDKPQTAKGKIHINFDVAMLNAIIKYTQCNWVQRTQLETILRLFEKIDINSYSFEDELKYRILLILAIVKGMVTENISDKDVLTTYVKDAVPEGVEILNNITLEENRLNKSECDTIDKAITERLQTSYLLTFKQDILDLYDVIEKPSFDSYYDAVKSLKDKLGNLMINLQSTCSNDEVIRQFNFSGYLYETLLNRIVERAKKASTVLYTGIKCFNSMLSPGFEGGRLYLLLGGTGKGKSGALLNIADQLRRYNPQIAPVENGIRKTLVFITMENTIN